MIVDICLFNCLNYTMTNLLTPLTPFTTIEQWQQFENKLIQMINQKGFDACYDIRLRSDTQTYWLELILFNEFDGYDSNEEDEDLADDNFERLINMTEKLKKYFSLCANYQSMDGTEKMYIKIDTGLI